MNTYKGKFNEPAWSLLPCQPAIHPKPGGMSMRAKVVESLITPDRRDLTADKALNGYDHIT